MLGGIAVSVHAEPVTLHVAVNGNDQATGTEQAPFATLERARDELRAMRADGQLAVGAEVIVHEGTYELGATFELTSEDSGSETAPVVYRAAEGEQVTLSGGRAVTDWQPVTDAAILARLDESARGQVLQADLRAMGIEDLGDVIKPGARLELFFDNTPMTVARWPNEGFVKIGETVGGKPFDVRGTKGDRVGKFTFDFDRPERWADEKDLWLHGYWFWDWSDQRQCVKQIDLQAKTIELEEPYHHYGYREGHWYYAFNALCEIDSPGEWYLDRETGILYFWPPTPIEDGRAVVSVCGDMLSMKDASHVTIRGLTFEGARGRAVRVEGGEGCRIVACTMRNLGDWAVRVDGGTDHAVVGCDMYDLAEGGVSITGGDRKTLTPANHLVDNNHIHHWGRWSRMYKSAVNVRGVGNRVAHNLLHDAPHTAIFFSGNEHIIELNEIHSVCYESNDAGAIYNGRDFTQRGTIIRHNYLHDITGFRGRGCVGVYLDDMLSGTRIESNVFYRSYRAAFIGGGRDCTIIGNVFVYCPKAIHIDARAMGWASASIEGTMKKRLEAMPYTEPPWSERYPELLTVYDDEPAVPKGNVVHSNVIVGEGWEDIQRQAKPHVFMGENLVTDDPGFVDLAGLNFQLTDESPAWDIGFVGIPVATIGLYESDDRASWPVTHEVRPKGALEEQ
jgi:hypothetical protein